MSRDICLRCLATSQGGPYRTRTCDPLRVMQVRYQLRQRPGGPRLAQEVPSSQRRRLGAFLVAFLAFLVVLETRFSTLRVAFLARFSTRLRAVVARFSTRLAALVARFSTAFAFLVTLFGAARTDFFAALMVRAASRSASRIS